jgi:hypothetical protein
MPMAAYKPGKLRSCFSGNSGADGLLAKLCHVMRSGDVAGPASSGESVMHGRITKFRHDMGVGIIVADNGRKFRFTGTQVRNSTPELVGQSVDFVVSGSRPTDIIMMSGSPWTAFGGIR